MGVREIDRFLEQWQMDAKRLSQNQSVSLISPRGRPRPMASRLLGNDGLGTGMIAGALRQVLR